MDKKPSERIEEIKKNIHDHDDPCQYCRDDDMLTLEALIEYLDETHSQ